MQMIAWMEGLLIQYRLASLLSTFDIRSESSNSSFVRFWALQEATILSYYVVSSVLRCSIKFCRSQSWTLHSALIRAKIPSLA